MKKRFDKSAWLRWFAGRNEVLMFTLSVLYLAGVAFLIVFWVDVPALLERARGLVDPKHLADSDWLLDMPSRLDRVVLVMMAGIWLVVIAEAVAHWLTRPWNRSTRRQHWCSLLFCLCPALRMGARSPEMHGRIWLPGLGWRQSGQRLQRQLERHFSVPMMAIALMIMPILIIEFFLKDQVAAYAWLRALLHFATGLIWFAFAAEFILMISVAEKKLDYCKRHWLDLAIIVLPFVSFLRSLSLAQTMRLTQVMRIQQLTNLARAYRLRGTALKAFRVLVLFDLHERILRVSDEKRIEKLEKKLGELERERRVLRQKIAKLKLKSDDPSDPGEQACLVPDGVSNSADQRNDQPDDPTVTTRQVSPNSPCLNQSTA
ncbi:prefoldin subunit [Roseiconus nitratireducens]|uniref:Prefoldin subunit n=1 Tax=Roseiconus nitratireducens TaxID=2605748 RepID=A0A5M6DIZ6_9BACT|nr:prefoldin subunit [Roseiconus nitratireducens]KAA5546179.1 prefoldin subunit [Roseiconus nitratireducens]